jgi:MFS family permease
MRYISTAIVNVFFGALVAKFGSKKLILLGFIAMFSAAILFAVGESVFVFYAGGALLGTGLSWTGTTIIGYVVNKACRKNKGTIMGLVLAANGLGGAIITQVITPFIMQEGNPFGYRLAYYVMAGILAVVFVLLLVFYKEPEKDISENEKPTAKKARGTGWVGIEFEKAKKRAYFYSACVCIFFTGMVLQGITTIYAAHMTDVGIDMGYISIVASVSSIALSLFKFLNGFFYDRFGLRITITIDCVSAIGVMICLLFVSNTPFGLVLAMTYAVLSAIALPLETVMLPIYANDLFGEKSFNKALGIFVSINQIGYALGGPIINLCFDLSGSYNLALIICAVIMFAVVICLQATITSANREKKRIIEEHNKCLAVAQ